MSADKPDSADVGLRYVQYDVQKENVYLDPIRQLIAKDLSGTFYAAMQIMQITLWLTHFRALQYLRLPVLLISMGGPVLYGGLAFLVLTAAFF